MCRTLKKNHERQIADVQLHIVKSRQIRKEQKGKDRTEKDIRTERWKLSCGLSSESSQEERLEMRRVRTNSLPPSGFYRNALEQPKTGFTPETCKLFHNKGPHCHSARKLHLRKYWQDQPPTLPHTHSHIQQTKNHTWTDTEAIEWYQVGAWIRHYTQKPS